MCTFLVPLCSGAQVTFAPSLKGLSCFRRSGREGSRSSCASPAAGDVPEQNHGRIERIAADPLGSLLLLVRFCFHLRKTTGVNLGKVIFGKVHRIFGPQFRFFTSGGANWIPGSLKTLRGWA